MPLIELPNLQLFVVDVAAWAIIHAGTGYLVHRFPVGWLDADRWWFRARRIERGGQLYERLGIKRWKDRLPEAGALFAGGVSKRSLIGRSPAGLRRFATETRRAELGHVLAASGGPLFFLWNPPGVGAVMVAYALMINAPFVAIQRYNRLRIARLLLRSSASDRSPSGASAERPTLARDTNGSSIP